MATGCGRRIVDMIWEDLKPSDILDRRSFENALIVHNALAGSTNAMIHLVALAGRAGVALKLTDFDDFAQKVPVIANLRPSGAWLMEDFYICRRDPRTAQAAGGPPASRRPHAVRNGDLITVDVSKRSIHLHLGEEEIAERLKTWAPPPRDYPRGYNRLFAQHVRQAHEGCDFDFLEGRGGIPEPEIH